MGLGCNRLACLVVIAALWLAGCGLKDDLYLPDKAPNLTEHPK